MLGDNYLVNKEVIRRIAERNQPVVGKPAIA